MTKPIEKKIIKAPPPTKDVNALYYVADGFDWIYEPKEPFSKVDVVLPNHFDVYREELRVGARITCRLGKIADGITEVELQIIECPQWATHGDVMVSVKGRDGRFTPCRHDGMLGEDEAEEDKPRKAA